MKWLSTLKTLLNNDITPDNIEDILFLLENYENGVNLWLLYLDSKKDYIEIIDKLFEFIDNTKEYLDEDWFLKLCHQRILLSYWLLDNVLEDKETLDYKLNYFTYNIDYFKKLLDDVEIVIELKIKILYLYNNISNKEANDYLYLLENKSISYNKDLLCLFLLTDNKDFLSFLIKNYKEINTEGNYVQDLILSKIMNMNNWLFESFVINKNIHNFNTNINIYKDDFLMLLNWIIWNFTEQEKDTIYSNIEIYKKISFLELVNNKFDSNAINISNENISELFNEGIYFNTNIQDIYSLNIKWNVSRYNYIKYNVVDLSVLNLSDILLYINNVILNNDVKEIVKLKSINNWCIWLTLNDIKTFDKECFDKNLFKEFLERFNFNENSDNKEIINIYKYFYENYNIPYVSILKFLNTSDLKELLVYNTDNKLELEILDIIKEKESEDELIYIYIKNLIDEDDFEWKYMFSYDEIIGYLRKSNDSNMDVVKKILSNKNIYSLPSSKLSLLVKFFISNNKELNNTLYIIDTVIDNIDNLKEKWYKDIILNDIILWNKDNISYIYEYINKMNSEIDKIRSDFEVSLGDKIKWFFWLKKEEEKIDILTTAQKNKENLEKISETKEEILNSYIVNIKENLKLIEKYKEHINEAWYIDIRTNLLQVLSELESIK